MKIKQNIILAFLIIAAVFLVAGCADRSKELLTEDFKKMGNEDLLRYFYRLNDEIESQEKQSGPVVLDAELAVVSALVRVAPDIQPKT